MELPMTTPTIGTQRLESPGATITYDVRGTLGTGTPLLVFGSPMGADGFATLAGHFPDRPVVTYDPRGVNRSARTDGSGELTPDDHADDLVRLVETIGGPVDVFATHARALTAKRGDQVRTLV